MNWRPQLMCTTHTRVLHFGTFFAVVDVKLVTFRFGAPTRLVY